MRASPTPVPPLTAITSVFTRVHSEILALGHLGELLEGFLDATVGYSLVRVVVDVGSPRLFARVLAHHDRQQPTVDPILQRHRLARAVGAALRTGNDAILRLCRNRPLRFDAQFLECAASSGRVESMQWALDLLEAERHEEFHRRRHHGTAHEVDAPGDVCSMSVLRERPECAVVDLRGYWRSIVDRLANDGHFGTIRWLWDRGHLAPYHIERVAPGAARHGDVEALQWPASVAVDRNRATTTTTARELLYNAASGGHCDVVVFVCSESPSLTHEDLTAAVNVAVERGHEAVARYLTERTDVGPNLETVRRRTLLERVRTGDFDKPRETLAAQFSACSSGDVGAVQTLALDHEAHFPEHCLALAAEKGHVAILEWFHEHPNHAYWGPALMDCAAGGGNLAVLEWLHRHRPEGGTTEAMDRAATSGNLEVIRWLHNNRSEGCSSMAMNEAAAAGHLAVVRFLWTHRPGNCDLERALRRAAMIGHLDVVQYLHGQQLMQQQQGRERESAFDIAGIVDLAVGNGDLEMVAWLLERHPHLEVPLNAVPYSSGDDVLEWLYARQQGAADAAATAAAPVDPDAVSGIRVHWGEHVLQSPVIMGNLRWLNFVVEHGGGEGGPPPREVIDMAADEGLELVLRWLFRRWPEAVRGTRLSPEAIARHPDMAAWLAAIDDHL